MLKHQFITYNQAHLVNSNNIKQTGENYIFAYPTTNVCANVYLVFINNIVFITVNIILFPYYILFIYFILSFLCSLL